MTILIGNLSEGEVIIIDSHDDIFKDYQIHFWRKDRISDILPAIKCPSIKSDNWIFKFSMIESLKELIYTQVFSKSIVIENLDLVLSVDLIYGDTIKYEPWMTLTGCNSFIDRLIERYELWEIDDCVCKPKKSRVLVDDFKDLNCAIDELEWISNINDAKLGMVINYENIRSHSNCDTMIFNHSARWNSYETSKLMFSGDSLTLVHDGNSYDFRLNERIKKSKECYIKGRI